MIDSHCHLDLDVFDPDREMVIQHAMADGVERCHIPGTEAYRWPQLLTFARSSFIDISLGLHPFFLNRYPATDIDGQLIQLRTLLESHCTEVFAVGECGLDASIDFDFERQCDVFEQQVRLAREFAKPLIVHARKTHHHIIRCLNECGYSGQGIIHAFSGSVETARHYTDRGWKLGIGGTITYPRGSKTRQTIKQVGIEHLVLETDAPDMPLFGFQGQRNVPAQIPLIAKAVAEILDMPVSKVSEITTQNYLALAQ